MSNFSELFKQLKELEGKTISTVEVGENYEETDVHNIFMTFTDGSTLKINPTSYNYGGQHLEIEIT